MLNPKVCLVFSIFLLKEMEEGQKYSEIHFQYVDAFFTGKQVLLFQAVL